MRSAACGDNPCCQAIRMSGSPPEVTRVCGGCVLHVESRCDCDSKVSVLTPLGQVLLGTWLLKASL